MSTIQNICCANKPILKKSLPKRDGCLIKYFYENGQDTTAWKWNLHTDLNPASLFEKRLKQRWFPVRFEKFSKHNFFVHYFRMTIGPSIGLLFLVRLLRTFAKYSKDFYFICAWLFNFVPKLNKVLSLNIHFQSKISCYFQSYKII